MELSTAIKVGTTAISVIKTISEIGKNDRFLSELNNISNLLEQVIEGQEKILTELRELRIEIREDLRSELIALLNNEFYGDARAIETQIARIPMSSRRAVLKELIQRGYLAKLEGLCWRMEEYGLPAATAALSLSTYFIWYIGVLGDLGASSRGLQSLRASFLNGWDQRFFHHWITEGMPGSLPVRIKNEQTLQESIKSQVNDHLKKVHLGFRRTGYVSCANLEYKVGHDHYINISGDLESGFSGSISIENRKHFDFRDNGYNPIDGDKLQINACINIADIENILSKDYDILRCHEEVEYVFTIGDGSDIANMGNQILEDLNLKSLQFNQSVAREVWLKWFLDWCVSARTELIAS
jgi:hypothetical protein